MSKVVVFANNKGGVGKSTLATNLTAARAKANPDEQILFVDLTFTASISSVLGAPPDNGLPMLMERLSLRRRQAQKLNLTALVSIVIARLLTDSLPALCAVCLLFTGVVAGVLWRLKRQVNPLTYATASKWYPNLHVLNGGEALAAFAGKPFPWRIAAEEWTVPAHIDIVAIDLDNTLDDFARFAMHIGNHVVVPTSLSMFDMSRIVAKDPRNNALVPFTRALGKAQIHTMIVNRVRCTGEDGDDYQFKVAAAEKALVEELTETLQAATDRDVEVDLMREIPGKFLQTMLEQEKPLVGLTVPSSSAQTFGAARDNLDHLASIVFRVID